MQREITYDFRGLDKIVNDIFYPLFKAEHRYLNLMGGGSSGKSVFAAQKVLKRILCEKDHNFGVFRKTATSIHASCWGQIMDVMERWNVKDHFSFNLSRQIMTHKYNGNAIRFSGLDDVDKLKSFFKLTGMWIEEATELMPADLIQLGIRMRGKFENYKQIILSYNPVSKSHWLRKAFFEATVIENWHDEERHRIRVFVKDPETGLELKSLSLVTTFNDNRFLEPEDETYLRTLKGNMYRVFALAEWGILEGLIYDPLIMENKTLGENLYPLSYDSESRGLDFGFNHAMVLVRECYKDAEIYEFEEYYKTGQTTNDLIVWMENNRISKTTIIYADSAEPDRIEEIRRAGFNCVGIKKGAGSVAAGIELCQSYNIHGREENINLNAEHDSYQWRVDRDGNPMDEPLGKKDDGMAARRYAIYGHLNDPMPEPEIFTI